MILHAKQDCTLLEKESSRRYSFVKGEHEVVDELAERLLQQYPAMFDEKYAPKLPPLTPQSQTTQYPSATGSSQFVCDVCGKQLSNAIGLTGHKRTHSKGITTSDLYK